MDAEFKGDKISPIEMLGRADALAVELLGEAEVIREHRLRDLKEQSLSMWSLVRQRMTALSEIANPKVEVVLVYKDHTQHTFKVPGTEPPKVIMHNGGGILHRVFVLRTNNYYDEVTPVWTDPPKPRKV